MTPREPQVKQKHKNTKYQKTTENNKITKTTKIKRANKEITKK